MKFFNLIAQSFSTLSNIKYNSLRFVFIVIFLSFFSSNLLAENCNNPLAITVPGTATGHLKKYGNYNDYYGVSAPSDGTIHIYTTGYSGDMDAYMYTSCSSSTFDEDTSGDANIDITFNATSGTNYILKLYAYSGNSNYTLHIDFISSVTTWVKNPTNTSAFTAPQPYGDNVDITETLTSQTNSTSINITAAGSTESGYDYLYITDFAGTTRTYDASFSETYTAVGPTVTIRFISDENTQPTDGKVTVSIADNIVSAQANPDYYSTSVNTAITKTATNGLFSNDTGTGITITGVNVAGLNGTLTYTASNGAFTFTPTNGFVGTTTFNYTITDSGGNTSSTTVTISVTATPLNATDNSYTTQPGGLITANVITDDTGSGSDSGDSITVTSRTDPTQGTVTIAADGSLSYRANSNATGTDTFQYTITDTYGQTATATISITIDTVLTSGRTLPFVLINPDYSRNLIGNYKIAGNTVLCLTSKRDGYGGSCTDNENRTSNGYVSKYLDIDSNNGTWNSTSSYIDLNATAYKPDVGIVWAGLFWGGRISSADTYKIRYAIGNGSNSYQTIEVGKGGNVGAIDVTAIGAQNVKLKIDGGAYTDVIASRFHDYQQTYAAFADVTSVFQGNRLSKAKHVFTVANLTTMEGREGAPGTFGGWSLVVIYAEDPIYGSPRNISIYNGFTNIGESDAPIEIAGFKLPKSQTVSANLSVFSGEGEYIYGKRPNHNKKDWMKISNRSNGTYQYMPGKSSGTALGNRDNMFDAQMDGILRDNIPGKFNDLSRNNVGVEVDNYDVSSIMTTYRNNDNNISSVYIKMYSNDDYITTSMMAFSAELYVPKLCYDYTLDIDGYVLTSTNNDIKTPFGDYGKPLTTALYLKSLEGDIPLSNVNVNYAIQNVSQVAYKSCPTSITWISETGQYDYSPACPYVHDGNSSGFGMYIGTGKTTSLGGNISPFEDRYIKFDSTLHRADIDTSFTFTVDYTVDYGSGAVPLTQHFNSKDLCEPTTTGFLPDIGAFNITDDNSPSNRWNLYSQVSKRPFALKLYAYKFENIADPTHPYVYPPDSDLNLTVEVEMIRADNFNRDANTACNDEHSKLTSAPSKFLHFGGSKVVDFFYAANELNFAYRSAAFRIWYLTNSHGDLLDNHNCSKTTQSQCVDLYSSKYTTDTECSTECRTKNSTGNCYNCLRTHYGHKVCSRDNFAIRPESFITQLYDSAENPSTTVPSTFIAQSASTNINQIPEFSLVSGYKYRFDVNATNHVNDVATPRYIQHFEPGDATHYVRMKWWPNTHDISLCNDVDDKNITLNIFNGSNVNFTTHTSYVDDVNQIGKYRFQIYDQNWTSADWNSHQMLHHTTGDYHSYYYPGNDCIKNSSSVSTAGTGGQQGCVISSVHSNADTGEHYKYLYAQYYPYSFDVSGLSYGARPGMETNSTFLYINTPNLSLYPDGVDENMSYNIQGTFAAEGKDHTPLSNFVEHCYADDVDMSLSTNYTHSVPSNIPALTYDLIDYNTTINDVIRARENGTLTVPGTTRTSLVITQNKTDFRKDMAGSITMDLGYNYARALNTPLNPRQLDMKDFNLTYATPPAGIFVDLQTNHKIVGNLSLDQNVTFVYARAKSALSLYDDIRSANTNTPISVLLYCDLGYTTCQNRGIQAYLAQTNDDSWWKSIDHDQSQGDGNIELVSTPVTALNLTSVNITSNGTNNSVNVNNGGVVPLTVPVNLVVDNLATVGPVKFTDRWLIYNPESNLTVPLPPSPFYRVRFIGSTGWAGYGDTGHVVGGTINEKKNKRLEW